MFRILLFLISIPILASNGTKKPKITDITFFEYFPTDIKTEIAKHFDLPDIRDISLINKEYYKIANIMWRQKYIDILGNFDKEDEEVYFTNKNNENIKDENGNNVVNWMLTFEKTLKKVVNNNLLYLKEHKKLKDSKRDKILAFVTFNKDNPIPDGADLTRANLLGATFDGLGLDQINFIGADLSRIVVKSTEFNDCDFTKAKLDFAIINNTEFNDPYVLNGTSLVQAKITNTKFNPGHYQIKNINFASASIEGTSFEASMMNINFSLAKLKNVKFDGEGQNMDLSFAELSTVRLAGIFKIIFNETKLNNVNFNQSQISQK